MNLKLIIILFSIKLIYTQNTEIIINKVLNYDDKNLLESTKNSNNFLNEILIDLTGNFLKNNPIEKPITSTPMAYLTNRTRVFQNFTSSINNAVSETKNTYKMNFSSSTNRNSPVLNGYNNSTLRLIKNRDLKVFFKGTNLTTINKLAKGKYHSMFSIDNIYENNSYYTVVKINKELLVLLASIISVILIAFTIITCLYRMINISNYNNSNYHHCRYHKY